ncbi:MAG TPA: response regulator [Bryobacteraceae bacterium]|jgi:CheY-like chemotaxis protein|nr:response regulator [Bryobacteraceae bacterium]
MKKVEILLVEDSPGDVRLIREATKETAPGIQITVAKDGVEAMDHLVSCIGGKSRWPDLILLDLNLPRKNGREVLAEVKGDPRLRQIPVVVMTSSQSDDDIATAYGLNANCFVTKPHELGQYIGIVQAIEDFWFGTAQLPRHFTPAANPASATNRTRV